MQEHRPPNTNLMCVEVDEFRVWAHFLGDALPWVCLALVALAPMDKRRGVRRFYIQTALSLFIAETLAQLGKLFEVWPERPGFPSGHTTWVTTLMMCLVLRERRWLFVAIPLVPTMGWALVYSEAHFARDVMGGFVLSVAVAFWVNGESNALRRAWNARRTIPPPAAASAIDPQEHPAK